MLVPKQPSYFYSFLRYALGLGGKADDYKVKQAHVELAARMRKRDPGSAPQMVCRLKQHACLEDSLSSNVSKLFDLLSFY